ncbi:MAG: histidine kinase, partial [Bacteroidetes bacterium]|nr:histidine kinase [Bacteroidota bacterium]
DDLVSIAVGTDGHFLVLSGNQVYRLAAGVFTPLFRIGLFSTLPPYTAMNKYGMIYRSGDTETGLRDNRSGKIRTIPFEQVNYRHNRFTCIDSLFYFNEISGATEYNLNTGSTRTFLPGKQVSCTFRDRTGNFWFTTLDQGIYRLNSDEFRTVRLQLPNEELSSAWAINRIGNRLMVGDNHNSVFVLSLPEMRLLATHTILAVAKNRIEHIDSLGNNGYYAASTSGMDKLDAGFMRLQIVKAGIKSITQKDDAKIIFAAFWGVGVFDLQKFKITDTLWRDRATTVYFRRDTVYIGTLNGLYAISPDKRATFLGTKIPFFKKRISAIAQSPDGTLWVASYDVGLVGYKDGKITAVLSKQQGLTSDLCRTILVHDNILWVGTERGLNRIALDQPGYPVTQYTSQDGLGSDIVNSIYADSTVVYVGTPAGISYFDETRIDHSEGCQLYLLSVQNSGRERIDDTASLSLPYNDKHLRLEYAGISYRSVGGIVYRYRLIGLDTVWRTTKGNFLEYPTLPAGSYDLQLQAINKFGTRSAILSLPFTAIAPFWQTAWFEGLLLVVFLLLVWLFVTIRIRQIHRRQTEKEELNRKVTEMEHLALQAQMNPHFIFNCMNSIQQYIFDQDIFAANKYIAGFSRLIRSTLQNSTRPFITLPEEISYLSGYLSLEKLRFKEKMDYSIEVDDAVNDPRVVIPPMLIQPYVENSMRHGLRHKVDGMGHIWLAFKSNGDHLVITVEDNGIGRKKAGSFKTREHIEYQSKGMSLTAERIRMINSKYAVPIFVDVIDLEDSSGRPQGTRVVMQLPFFHIMLEKENL